MVKSSFLVLLLLTVLALGCQNQDKQKVDLLVFNGQVFSFHDQPAVFAAFVVENGRILDTGSKEALLQKYQPYALLNLKGKVVYPGLHDGHAHFAALGKGLNEVDLRGANSWQEVIERIRKYEKENPKKEWILGRGWNQNLWESKDFPDRKLLDELFKNKAVYLTRIDGHAGIANARALEKAGINKETRVDGGRVVRRANGELSGVLIDNACNLVEAAVPAPSDEEWISAFMSAQAYCLPYGITAITDAGVSLRMMQLADSLQKLGKLKMRLNLMLTPGEKEINFAVNEGIYQTDALQVSSFKLYADGALGSRGALLLQPYCDQPAELGLQLHTYTFYDSICRLLKKHQFQVNTHCIGDSANRMMLKLYGKVLDGDKQRRWRVEHAQVVAPEDFNLFKKYGVIASVQPTHATSDMPWAPLRLCNHRMNGAYAYKTLLNQNNMLVLGTDFPVEEVNPMFTYLSAAYRVNPDLEPAEGFQKNEALDSLAILQGMTYWPAYAAFRESDWGSLKPGAFADFIVLENTLPSLSPAHLSNQNPVTEVWISGKKLWDYKMGLKVEQK